MPRQEPPHKKNIPFENSEAELVITRLGGLADGVGRHAGRDWFVPYTLPGETVRARPLRQTKNAVFAVPTAILAPSPERQAAVCPHFGVCGGCRLQHLTPKTYDDFKRITAREAVRKAGFDPEVVAPVLPARPASRRRATLVVQAGALWYHASRSHTLTQVTACPVLEPALLALAHDLAAMLPAGSLQINGVEDGYDALFEPQEERPFDEGPPAAFSLDAMPDLLRLSVRREGDIVPYFTRAVPSVYFSGVRVAPPPGAFLQAVRETETRLQPLLTAALAGSHALFDGFAGLGGYGLMLRDAITRIEGFDSDTPTIRAGQTAIAQAGLEARLSLRQRDLFHAPLTGKELARYDAVLLNPPRLGAEAQCRALAAAGPPRLVMISCYPATFTRDARLLAQGGYKLRRATPIDQFHYGPALEIVAEFFR